MACAATSVLICSTDTDRSRPPLPAPPSGVHASISAAGCQHCLATFHSGWLAVISAWRTAAGESPSCLSTRNDRRTSGRLPEQNARVIRRYSVGAFSPPCSARDNTRSPDWICSIGMRPLSVCTSVPAGKQAWSAGCFSVCRLLSPNTNPCDNGATASATLLAFRQPANWSDKNSAQPDTGFTSKPCCFKKPVIVSRRPALSAHSRILPPKAA